MNLVHSLKQGIIPAKANPVDVILVADKENLTYTLKEQIEEHKKLMEDSTTPNPVRKKFRLKCDFSEAEMTSLSSDLKIWTKRKSGEQNMLSNYICDERNGGMNFGIINSLNRNKLNKPVPDSSVTTCYQCNTQFSMMFRRHHCRACGRIFCSTCCQSILVIPRQLVNYRDTENWYIEGKPQKVCEKCKLEIESFAHIENLVRYFEIVAYDFESCIKASTLCKNWREAVRIYLSDVRDIQYTLPSKVLSTKDINFMLSNEKNLQGHSKWMMQLLKIKRVDQTNIRNKSCSEMMCDAHCSNSLNPYDAIIILNSEIYGPEIKTMAINVIKDFFFRHNNSDMYDPLNFNIYNSQNEPILNNVNNFSMDLPNKLLHNLSIFLPIEDSSVQDFVLETKELFLDFFWLSRINMYGSYSSVFCNKLLLSNQEQAYSVQESLKLITILEENFSNPCAISSNLRTLELPFIGPFGTISSFDYEIVVKKSATNPIMIKYVSDGNKKALIFKKEDIRKDAHLVSLIRIMYNLCYDVLLNYCSNCSPNTSNADDFSTSPPSTYSFKHRDCDSYDNLETSDDIFVPELASYRVMPTSDSSGFIEVVPNSDTIYHILDKGTISNFLYHSNMYRKVNEINKNYTISLAFWTVVTYLFGVGDRHLENIMIRNDGIIFHIDYGFVFGSDSLSSSIRLDKHLIEGLGGIDMYQPFRALCCDIYCCLRHHVNIICSCLLRLSKLDPPVSHYNFTPAFIEKFVVERFLIGQTEEEARLFFSTLMDKNCEKFINKIYDTIHHTVSSFKVSRWW